MDQYGAEEEPQAAQPQVLGQGGRSGKPEGRSQQHGRKEAGAILERGGLGKLAEKDARVKPRTIPRAGCRASLPTGGPAARQARGHVPPQRHGQERPALGLDQQVVDRRLQQLDQQARQDRHRHGAGEGDQDALPAALEVGVPHAAGQLQALLISGGSTAPTWPSDPLNNAQRGDTLLGKILRLNPDNPTASVPGNQQGLIWDWGLRNPWRFSFDRETGELYAGDVGQNSEEEIDRIVRARLASYSRPILEGSAEWETLYRKACEEESRKRKKPGV